MNLTQLDAVYEVTGHRIFEGGRWVALISPAAYRTGFELVAMVAAARVDAKRSAQNAAHLETLVADLLK